MLSARAFLVRGLLAGLVAGLVAFGVAYVVGEPSVNAAIALEDAAAAAPHSHADDAAAAAPHSHATEAGGAVVPRSLQSTLGLLTATAMAGVTLGGLMGVLTALALGRFGRLGARGTALAVAGAGFVTLYVLPSLVYPPNPPAVGSADTLQTRTAAYFTLVAVSVVAATTAVLAGRRLARSWGNWYATLTALAAYLTVTLVAGALLPAYAEVPADYPATVLWDFRLASFVIQLVLWAVLGLVLAELAHRLTHPTTATRRLRQPV